MKRNGFTLIELLAVILILGALFAILTPAIRNAVMSARDRRVASDKKTLASAMQSYHHEYHRWPDPFDSFSGTVSYSNDNCTVINMMDPANMAKNPKQIKFLSLSDYQLDQAGNILNPRTAKPYRICFNFDDNKCWVE